MGYGTAGSMTSSKMPVKMAAILVFSNNWNFSKKCGNVTLYDQI